MPQEFTLSKDAAFKEHEKRDDGARKAVMKTARALLQTTMAFVGACYYDIAGAASEMPICSSSIHSGGYDTECEER